MSIELNTVLFARAAETMKKLHATRQAACDVGSLLADGNKSEMEQRWKCSAVLTKSGEWHVVPAHDQIKVYAGDKIQVKTLAGGSLVGQHKWRDAAWLRENAAKIFMGSVQLPDETQDDESPAEGSSSRPRVRLISPDAPPPDGVWRATVPDSGDAGPVALSDALATVGADAVVAEEMGGAPEEETIAVLPLLGRSGRGLATSLHSLGLQTADGLRAGREERAPHDAGQMSVWRGTAEEREATTWYPHAPTCMCSHIGSVEQVSG